MAVGDGAVRTATAQAAIGRRFFMVVSSFNNSICGNGSYFNF
jgi:hypothetical protein